MSPQLSQRQSILRETIAGFLSERLRAKLDKIKDDEQNSELRGELRARFVAASWLEDAARRVGWLQAVTHSLKQIHPDARGSELLCAPTTLASLTELGSHALGIEFEVDVVGNAAALDVYAFLRLDFEGNSLLSLATRADADFAAALSDDPDKASRWMSAFAALTSPRATFGSHTHAKQLYWPVGNDPHDDNGYHLLAPLYPTSLVHRVYLRLQDDRFGESAKAARDVRKRGEWHESPVREYTQLAIQKLGGTKPQNISQLNSERRGDNCLLASVPPVWQSKAVQPVLGVSSLFAVFQWRREVRSLTAQLRRYLESDPTPNQEARQRREELLDSLLDELIQFTAELHELEPGWTRDARCELKPAHMAWLDPRGIETHVSDTPETLASDFANWLNAQLRTRLPMGDAEYLYWRRKALDLLKETEREGANVLA
jgi:CRISPR-associated protein Csy1